MNSQQQLSFDGATFVPERDGARLTKQINKVFDLMKDGQWRTLADIAFLTDAPESSISARLRDLRKPRFGGYTVERQSVRGGLFQYRILTGDFK